MHLLQHVTTLCCRRPGTATGQLLPCSVQGGVDIGVDKRRGVVGVHQLSKLQHMRHMCCQSIAFGSCFVPCLSLALPRPHLSPQISLPLRTPCHFLTGSRFCPHLSPSTPPPPPPCFCTPLATFWQDPGQIYGAGGVFEEAIATANLLLHGGQQIAQTVRTATFVDNTWQVSLPAAGFMLLHCTTQLASCPAPD